MDRSDWHTLALSVLTVRVTEVIRVNEREQQAGLDAALDRGWVSLDELLNLASGSPVDADEATDLARDAGIHVDDEDEAEPWEDVRKLADEGPDAFREVREGPAHAEDLGLDNPAALYLREISRTPLLTAEEEIQLAKEREAGEEARKQLERGVQEPSEREQLEEAVRVGDAARHRLIESNLRLVVSVAKKYLGRGLSFLDLVQEGNLGLQKGVEKYDWRKGFRFSTYAYWWIRQAVGRAVAEQGRTIRLPSHIFELLTKLYNTARTMQSELGRSPTPEEIAERMGIEPERVRDAFQAARIPISLNKPIGEDASSTVGDVVADALSRSPHEEAEETVLAESVDRALRQYLTGREARVVRLRFGLDRQGEERTLGEVGKELGLSRERVRQLESEALAKLRHAAPFRRQFRDYLE